MLTALTELCQELRNWFDRDRRTGTFEITGGSITADFLQNGQYYRIIGSIFNDGIHQFPVADLKEETFEGSVWALAIPEPVIKLSEDIEAWREKNEDVDSANMSPFQSESFGGYSYSKVSTSGQNTANGGGLSWKNVFASRMNAWRKL